MIDAADTVTDSEHGCILWRGGLGARGQPVVWQNGRRVTAWRVAWETSGQTVPDGYSFVPCSHSRACVNPDHLRCLPHAEAVSIGNRRAWARRQGRTLGDAGA